MWAGRLERGGRERESSGVLLLAVVLLERSCGPMAGEGGRTSLYACGHDKAPLDDIGWVFILGQAPEKSGGKLYARGLFRKRPRSGGRVVQKPAPSHFVIQGGPLRVGRAVARKARHELRKARHHFPAVTVKPKIDRNKTTASDSVQR